MTFASFPKISIVVVNFNLARYLEKTLESIISQEYPNLELLVVDGGSSDGSVEIIKKYAARIAWWVSEPDRGQYDAITKGFAKSTGSILAWLNSDDMYHPHAFEAVAEIFTSFPEIAWLTGAPTAFNDQGTSSTGGPIAEARWSKWRFFTVRGQFIQQESTFWRRDLWEQAGSNVGQGAQLAGDFELWLRFFRHADLYTTTAILGGFRYRDGDQRSLTHKRAYLAECRKVLTAELCSLALTQRFKVGLLRWAMIPFAVCWRLSVPVLRAVYRYAMAIPDLIRYDFDAGRWRKSNY